MQTTSSFSFWRLLNVLIISLLLWTGCQSDSKATAKDLVGDWKCTSAELNGKPHDAATGFYFKFTETALTSNLLPELQLPETMDGYELKDNKILLSGAAETFFVVEEFKDGNLVLGLDANDMKFKFNLQKN